jgi:TolB-like protein
MLKYTLFPFVLALSACAIAKDTPEIRATMTLPQSNINYLTQSIVDDLTIQNKSLRPDQPLVVSTPVMVGDLVQSNALASQLQQGMMAAFHKRAFNVIDVNVADALRVTPEGDFILSRNWELLPSDVPVEHVVVSSMSRSVDGMAVNSRIVNVLDNRVISATQVFIKTSQLPGYLQPSERVVSREGLLYRHTGVGNDEVTVLGEIK